VRGLRFNLKRAAADITGMTLQALRAHELVGWHVEVYIDGQMLASLQPVISKLPVFAIDHLGMSERVCPTCWIWSIAAPRSRRPVSGGSR